MSQPSHTPTENPTVVEARATFQDGVALARAEQWALALRAFERSAALHSHAITTYDIGFCERMLGHSTRARKMLAKSLSLHHASGDVELPAELVTAAGTYLNEADGRVARVTLTIASGAVAVDGRPLELAEPDAVPPILLAGTRAVGAAEPLPSGTVEVILDPGPHRFVLSAKGRPDAIASVAVGLGSRTALEIHVPEAQLESKQSVPAPREMGTLVAKSPDHTVAYIALGSGAAAAIVGTVSGLVAFGKKDDVSRACAEPGAHCTSERESGLRAADIATVAFITAGAAVGLGTVLLLTASADKAGRPSKSTADLVVRTTLSLGAFGIEGRF
jgi:hypothetical protein